MSELGVIERWKDRVKLLRTETYAIYLAYKDPRVPWYSKVFIALIIGYAFSPIDLIPDFIPVLGYLDDLILVPIGIVIALKMIPDEVMQECKLKASEKFRGEKPTNWVAAIIIISVWLLLAAIFVILVVRSINSNQPIAGWSCILALNLGRAIVC